MWICLHDAFYSIVDKDCDDDELLVRARRPGDIEKLFPEAKVLRDDSADYLFRARIRRADLITALAMEVESIDYPNFKSSVKDDRLRDSYALCWSALAEIQPITS